MQGGSRLTYGRRARGAKAHSLSSCAAAARGGVALIERGAREARRIGTARRLRTGRAPRHGAPSWRAHAAALSRAGGCDERRARAWPRAARRATAMAAAGRPPSRRAERRAAPLANPLPRAAALDQAVRRRCVTHPSEACQGRHASRGSGARWRRRGSAAVARVAGARWRRRGSAVAGPANVVGASTAAAAATAAGVAGCWWSARGMAR